MASTWKALAAGAGLVWVACGGGDGTYEVHGVVRGVNLEFEQVVIEHEDIPGLMPAMTMNFDLADPSLLEGLEKGQHVSFTLRHTPQSYTITRIAVLGHGDLAGAEALLDPAARAEPAPPFALVDQDGEPLALADLRGKAVLLDFVFTNCRGPCPILTSRHVTLQRRLDPSARGRAHFVSISLDPVRDTPAALRKYATVRGADLEGWSFLTGPPAEVEEVVRSYGVGKTRAPDGEIVHLVATFLIDPEGRVAERYIGLEDELDAIQRDLERLL